MSIRRKGRTEPPTKVPNGDEVHCRKRLEACMTYPTTREQTHIRARAGTHPHTHTPHTLPSGLISIIKLACNGQRSIAPSSRQSYSIFGYENSWHFSRSVVAVRTHLPSQLLCLHPFVQHLVVSSGCPSSNGDSDSSLHVHTSGATTAGATAGAKRSTRRKGMTGRAKLCRL